MGNLTLNLPLNEEILCSELLPVHPFFGVTASRFFFWIPLLNKVRPAPAAVIKMRRPASWLVEVWGGWNSIPLSSHLSSPHSATPFSSQHFWSSMTLLKQYDKVVTGYATDLYKIATKSCWTSLEKLRQVGIVRYEIPSFCRRLHQEMCFLFLRSFQSWSWEGKTRWVRRATIFLLPLDMCT